MKKIVSLTAAVVICYAMQAQNTITTNRIITDSLQVNSKIKADVIRVSRITSPDSLIRFGDSTAFYNTLSNNITYNPVSSFIKGFGLGNGGTTGRGQNSTAIGTFVSTGVSANNAISLGSSTGQSLPLQLVNGISNSLMVGFNSNIPTLFVGPSTGLSTTGNVGIGLTSPQEKLQVEGHGRFGAGNDYIRLGFNSVNAILDNFGQGNLLINYYSGKDVVIGNTSNPNGVSNLFVAGNVGLGTGVNSNYRLSVNGHILAKEVTVETGWSDYVFEGGYKLMPLKEVEQFISKHKHLPGVTKGSDIETRGLNIGEMQAKHMEKIEELTLYIIELQKQIDELKRTLEKMDVTK